MAAALIAKSNLAMAVMAEQRPTLISVVTSVVTEKCGTYHSLATAMMVTTPTMMVAQLLATLSLVSLAMEATSLTLTHALRFVAMERTLA
jgi:hypothetical protein